MESPTPAEITDGTCFPEVPSSWYYLATLAEISRAPVAFTLPGGRRFVAFQSKPGVFAVLDARCSHMGADLSLGTVSDGRIACPLHGWAYGAHGRCEAIPAGESIPPFACQRSYPTAVVGSLLFFFNRRTATFPMPFFAGRQPEELRAARAFEFIVDAPWYLIGANGFDLQHFRCAHDRALVGEPVLDQPSDLSWRLRARFRITGKSLLDRLTKFLSGTESEMTIENWNGNLVLVTSRFRRSVTYGLVSFVPLEGGHTRVRNIVWSPRRPGWQGRVLDPLDTAIRRLFIREFVRSDVDRSRGIRFHRARMIQADRVLVEYLAWLQHRHGISTPENV